MWVKELSVLDCTNVLIAGRLAHLGCMDGTRPYVVPIYFAYSDHHLYSFSMPGRKIECMRSNPHVCLQVDERGHEHGWKSVIIQGVYQELEVSDGLAEARTHAWQLLSKYPIWWEPGSLKPKEQPVPQAAEHYGHIYFRVRVESVTGREAKYPEPQAS